jgi:hypothetical protein
MGAELLAPRAGRYGAAAGSCQPACRAAPVYPPGCLPDRQHCLAAYLPTTERGERLGGLSPVEYQADARAQAPVGDQGCQDGPIQAYLRAKGVNGAINPRSSTHG